MAAIGLTAATVPGEGAIIAIASMIEELAKGQTPEQKKILWDRYIELTAPWHSIAVEMSKDVATLVAKLMKKE